MKNPFNVSKFYVLSVILISIILFGLRILFNIYQEELSSIFIFNLLIQNRDLNFKTNYDLMSNGILYYYREIPPLNDVAIYLYFWYFIFFPFYLLPYDFSLYLWDILRLLSAIYIAIKMKNILTNRTHLTFFYAFCAVGYLADMYLNNTNWLIQLLLIESYIQWNYKRKVLSGILFTLTTFKVILIAFPLILLLTKKIQSKNLIYFFFPLFLICIPYIIFPNYFCSMFSNWISISNINSDLSLIDIFQSTWRIFQPGHLLFISFFLIVIIINIKNEIVRNKIAKFLYMFVFTFWILIWIIFIEFSLFL
jgi:hypothetical protein